MSHVAGTIGSLRLDLRDGGKLPEKGDVLRSGPSGACYSVLDARQIDAKRICPGWTRWKLGVLRMGYDAVSEADATYLTQNGDCRDG